MDFNTYQTAAMTTDQRQGRELADIAVHLLGLAGEAGSVAAEYKKYLRDGDAHAWWKSRIRDELGDVLWYVAAVAHHLDLNLDEVAAANLEKTKNRWVAGDTLPLDSDWPENERLPREGTYEFRPTHTHDGRPHVEVYFNGVKAGDTLTDASHIDDGYRFHDIFHLSYAVYLGWSPVTRQLLKRKRKSSPNIDENEDGGRAIVIEEGIAALAFAYASQHDHLEGITHLDQRLLETITMVTGPVEVGARSEADWERAILAGFKMFRLLVSNEGGSIDFNADEGTMAFRPL